MFDVGSSFALDVRCTYCHVLSEIPLLSCSKDTHVVSMYV